jgi:hypothetical protein
MTDHTHEPVFTVASEIAAWRDAARSLPLSKASDIAREAMDHLGCVLDNFTTVYRDQRDGQASTQALEQAVMQVARQATGAAIFTLAVTSRTREAAALN